MNSIHFDSVFAYSNFVQKTSEDQNQGLRLIWVFNVVCIVVDCLVYTFFSAAARFLVKFSTKIDLNIVLIEKKHKISSRIKKTKEQKVQRKNKKRCTSGNRSKRKRAELNRLLKI